MDVGYISRFHFCFTEEKKINRQIDNRAYYGYETFLIFPKKKCANLNHRQNLFVKIQEINRNSFLDKILLKLRFYLLQILLQKMLFCASNKSDLHKSCHLHFGYIILFQGAEECRRFVNCKNNRWLRFWNSEKPLAQSDLGQHNLIILPENRQTSKQFPTQFCVFITFQTLQSPHKMLQHVQIADEIVVHFNFV